MAHHVVPSSASVGVSSAGAERRNDLQVLRALAVTLVFLYHLDLRLFRGGFIGVDVFFVLSGYLVFGSLLRELSAPSCKFSLSTFLSRRAKRLSLPSGACLLILAVYLLSCQRCRTGACLAMFADIGPAALHSANLKFLSSAVGYFSPAAPSIVLHFWSLAVEEQVYVALPLLLMTVRKTLSHRALGSVMALAGLGSFSLLVLQGPDARFFFFASRVWEFLIGAVIAYRFDPWRATAMPSSLPSGTPVNVPSGLLVASARYSGKIWCVGVGALVFLNVVTSGLGYPNILATVPVVAIAAVLVAVRLNRRMPLVEKLGDVSYSVYLYHWPIIQLLKNHARLHPNMPPLWLMAVILTTLFTVFSYNVVELWVQRARWSNRQVLAVFLAATLVPAALAQAGVIFSNRKLVAGIEGPAIQPQHTVEDKWLPPKLPTPPWFAENRADPETLLRNIEVAEATPNVGPWVDETKRSKHFAVVLIGDSMAHQLYYPMATYAQSLNVSFVIKTAPAVGHPDHWISHIVPNKVTPEMARYSHRVFVLSGGYNEQIDYKLFRQTLAFWANQSCTVVVANNPRWWTNKGPNVCMKEHLQNLTACDLPMNKVRIGKDVKMYEEMTAASPGLRENTDMMSVNDYVGWNNTFHVHIGETPVMLDSLHFSIPFVKLITAYWVERFRETKCVRAFESALRASSSTP